MTTKHNFYEINVIMEDYVAPISDLILCYFRARTSKNIWVYRDYPQGYVYENHDKRMTVYTHEIDKVVAILVKSRKLFQFGDHLAYTNPWPPSEYDHLEPVITMDLIIYEVVKHLSFQTTALVGSTCKILDAKWRGFVKIFPPTNLVNEHYINPCEIIKNTQLSLFTNLTSLDIRRNSELTNGALIGLTNLVSLCLGWNKNITGIGLINLSGLQKLSLGWNENITDENLVGLSQLTSLDIGSNPVITGCSFGKLVHLRSLCLEENRWSREEAIPNKFLYTLTNLTGLSIRSEYSGMDDNISLLVNLKSLKLGPNKKITNKGLSTLSNLRELSLGYNESDLNGSISLLVNLTSLKLGSNKKITIDCLSQLTNLTSLELGANKNIANECLSRLTNLVKRDFW